ncbi:MAG: hypothetical protein H0U71_07345 [Gammaproteobacteria bacterium]|nr:hypothetical protein [Gammaproteobacteria bacterium]
MVASILKNYKKISNSDVQEQLSECLIKADALTNVALSTNFIELSPLTIYSYLWLLSDLIGQARNLNEQ